MAEASWIVAMNSPQETQELPRRLHFTGQQKISVEDWSTLHHYMGNNPKTEWRNGVPKSPPCFVLIPSTSKESPAGSSRLNPSSLIFLYVGNCLKSHLHVLYPGKKQAYLQGVLFFLLIEQKSSILMDLTTTTLNTYQQQMLHPFKKLTCIYFAKKIKSNCSVCLCQWTAHERASCDYPRPNVA